MLKPLPNLPAHVVGFMASGQVTASDYESVLIPAIESAIKQHGRVRLLYQIGPAFAGFTAGAMWDDAKVGVSHLRAWERVAVVTDVEWIAWAVRLFRFAIPCPAKVFANSQYAEAVDWIAI
jgi:hypothetical protein